MKRDLRAQAENQFAQNFGDKTGHRLNTRAAKKDGERHIAAKMQPHRCGIRRFSRILVDAQSANHSLHPVQQTKTLLFQALRLDKVLLQTMHLVQHLDVSYTCYQSNLTAKSITSPNSHGVSIHTY